MATDYATFDISDYLDNDDVIAEYLSAAAEDQNLDVLLLAISHVAKARGMGQIAAAAGLQRESLYKALSPGSHPRFETVSAVLRALNVHIAVVANADKAEESEPEYASQGA
jgi:probable addiction module antidote protein